MSRKIAGQVSTNVSRLLQGGFLKEEPVWYQSVITHPPAPPLPRSPIPRPANDLPPSLAARKQQTLRRLLGVNAAADGSAVPSSTSTSSGAKAAAAPHHPRMSAKRLRSLTPALHPQPIFYLQDRVRRQFYRDHPWEAYRPRMLVEMDKVVVIDKTSPLGAPEDARELRAWGRNPGPEDVVSCTIHLHQKHGLSLSQAYQHTIASYHALRSEHDIATRYAAHEAEAYGHQFGLTETTRVFLREHRRIFGTEEIEPDVPYPSAQQGKQSQGATASSTPRQPPPTMISVQPVAEPAQEPSKTQATQGQPQYIEPRGKDRARRIKNVDETFTAGDRYLEAALSTSQAALARLRS
ncbi:hypothetical protein V8E36_001961 [Tilletia maclaganii]